jgi:hypothetical protein
MKIMKPTRISLAKEQETTRSASVAVLGPEFDNFLFATIGEDRNEMPLSVLSALARLDIDPWQEAAELARVPRETATRRLASSIAALPDGPSAHLDCGTIAARLIALLPSRTRSDIPPRQTLPDAGDAAKLRAGIFMYAVFIAFILAAQWIAVSRLPPAQVDSVHAPASSAVFPQISPPNSSK